MAPRPRSCLFLFWFCALGSIMLCVGAVVDSAELAALKSLRDAFPSIEAQWGWSDSALASVCENSTTLSGLECRYVSSDWHVETVYDCLFLLAVSLFIRSVLLV
jgi:hypothetical protein